MIVEDIMLIGVDLDGMLLSFPNFFEKFFHAMQEDKDTKVGIITARRMSEQDDMIAILKKLNINPDFFVAMPDDLKDKNFSQGTFKAKVCNDMKIDLLFDDFLSDDPKMMADFFTLNQKTVPFTSFAYEPGD